MVLSDQHPRFTSGTGKAQSIDHIVEPSFQERQQVLPCDSLLPVSFFEIATKLSFQEAIHPPHLLFFAELNCKRRAVLPRGIVSPFYAALVGITSIALQKQFHAFSSAQSTNRPRVSGQNASSSLNTSPLGRSTTVVGNGRYILNQIDLQSSCLKRSKRRFPSSSWPLDIDINEFHTMVHGLFGSILGC